MFERPHHQRIARVLASLNAPLLADHGCWFGGGTAIALRYGEFRESVDIDFLVSDLAGYRALRQLLTGPAGFAALMRDGVSGIDAREMRADQYGLRTRLSVEAAEIKFEIVLEGRIALVTPGVADAVCGVSCLTPLDLLTSKLLANADRWADDGVFSRDLIDLSFMAPKPVLLRAAVSKAEQAYGEAVRRDLARAVDQLARRDGRLERCMQALRIAQPKAVLWQRIRAVARVVAPM